MGKAKKRKSRSSERPRTVAPGDQFGHGLPGRRRALMALDNLKPAQMPLLLDAFDNTATPALRHLEPYALAVPELDTFRRTRRIGPTLARWSQLLGVSADTLLLNQEHYFCLGSNERTVGAVDEQVLTAMYCAYRCSSGATIDRHAYYASEEITALILAGSESSAEVGVTAADLPSPTGVAHLSQSAGALLLLWQVLDDDLLSVQLVPAEGARSFISNDGAPKTGWGYRFINHMYLPIPTAEALLSPVESDAPPSLQASGGFTPRMPADAPRDERGIYQGWSTERILEVFISFTHMLRQDSTVRDVADRRSPTSETSRTRRKGTVTYLTHRASTSRKGESGKSSRTYSTRWVVRGHWRRHWYPSEQRHHPKWISTYIAGPEGAPITPSDKVTVL